MILHHDVLSLSSRPVARSGSLFPAEGDRLLPMMAERLGGRAVRYVA
jgi:hypothetical protein